MNGYQPRSTMGGSALPRKGRDPDTHEFAVSTALGDIEVTLRVPESVRESWDDLGARVALQTLAAQLAQFDPRAPQHVDDQATTNPIDLTKE